jgi:exonuclease SbcC
VELSSGLRDLNSMFLDEGFGTLDEDTLDTVASTLERVAADSGRMVGIVTHVAALAERVPVRFVVSRTGATSALRQERA